MEQFFAEESVVKTIIGPVDLNTAANTGGRTAIANATRVAFVLAVGAGSSTSAHTITLRQHTLASGGSSYDLAVSNPYYHKVNAATSFTRVDPGSDTAAYDLHSLLADHVGIVIFEVLAEQLRSDCGWVSIDVTDSGGAQLGTAIAVVDPKFFPAYTQIV